MTNLRIISFLATITLSVACTPAATSKGGSTSGPKASNAKAAPRNASDAPLNHGPYEVGACATCHATDDANNPGAVANKGADLCYGCHDQFAEEIAKHKVQHAAMASCIDCHNPHNATSRAFVHSTENDLCFGCHEKLASQAHPKGAPAEPKNTCVTCHAVHAADTEFLLLK